jgi:nucleolar protein 15
MAKLDEHMVLDSSMKEEFETKLKSYKSKANAGADEPGVVYIGHIPRGFFEPQMKKYFSQFGDITRLKVSRSKRTGKCKGYAFIEFASKYTAKTVAECMNNYLMFHRLLKCEEVPSDRLHPDTFKGCGSWFRKPKGRILARDRHNKPQTPTQQRTTQARLKSRVAKSLGKLTQLGVDYQLPMLRSKTTAAKKQ